MSIPIAITFLVENLNELSLYKGTTCKTYANGSTSYDFLLQQRTSPTPMIGTAYGMLVNRGSSHVN